MMTKFLSRVSRSLSFGVLATALAASGCDAPVDDEAPVVERSATPAQISNAIAQDADFLALIDVSTELAGELYAAQRALPPETVDAIVRTITHPSFADTTDPPTLVKDLGGNPAHLDTIRNLSLELIARYGLQESSPDQIRSIIGGAFQHESARSRLDGAIENELHDVTGDLDTDFDQCEAQCAALYAVAAGLAMSGYIGELIAAVATGPGGVIIAILGLAQFNYEMALAQSALNNCMDECHGEYSDECGWDPDCLEGEYCWKGILGFGENECRPQKEEGKVCSRDAQCESGCCKFHLWSNPVSQVCRPADRCD